MQLQPVKFRKEGAPGDWVHEVRDVLRRAQGPRGGRTLWIYNDNEQHRRTAIEGEGNAKVRPYNKFGAHAAEPLAAGVTTGSNGQGYKALTDAVRAVIDEDLALISRLLQTGDYSTVRYSATSLTSGNLGTGHFQVGTPVKKYIVAGLKRCVQLCNERVKL